MIYILIYILSTMEKIMIKDNNEYKNNNTQWQWPKKNNEEMTTMSKATKMKIREDNQKRQKQRQYPIKFIVYDVMYIV